MKTLGYYNGRYGELEEMSIPMNDRVCWFGDGVYDATTARNYHVFAMDEHIDRFFNSAAMLEMEIPVSKAQLRDLLQEMVAKLDTGDQFVYYQLTRGTGIRDHIYTEGPGNLWIMLKPLNMGDCTKEIRLISLEDTRFFHCNIKTLNLINATTYATRAHRAGCTECVLWRPDLLHGTRVTECAHSNVSIIRDGQLVTAPTDNLILPGIGRAHLISACKRLGIAVNEVPYTLQDVRDAEEIIVTSSTKLALRAVELDGQPAGKKRDDLWEAIRREVLGEYIAATGN